MSAATSRMIVLPYMPFLVCVPLTLEVDLGSLPEFHPLISHADLIPSGLGQLHGSGWHATACGCANQGRRRRQVFLQLARTRTVVDCFTSGVPPVPLLGRHFGGRHGPVMGGRQA